MGSAEKKIFLPRDLGRKKRASRAMLKKNFELKLPAARKRKPKTLRKSKGEKKNGEEPVPRGFWGQGNGYSLQVQTRAR